MKISSPHHWLVRNTCLVVTIIYFGSCSTSRKVAENELSSGRYVFKQSGRPPEKIDLQVHEDSLTIIRKTDGMKIKPEPNKEQIFLKTSFDVDVMVLLFKYRPSAAGLPRQLNTNFNGNVFFGYRQDRYNLKLNKSKWGMKRELYHFGYTVGGFIGLGSTFVSPWTTNNQTTDEYDGLILTRGISTMLAINNFTVGAGIGWDYLTDRDKNIWIYQNKPWL